MPVSYVQIRSMLIELARQAYNALKHNRRRSILTMLGMAWGIATVVLLLAYGSGFERGLWVAFRSWGTNLVFVFPGRTSLQAGGTKAGSEIKLTVNDLDYLQAEVPLLKRISPEAFKQSTVAYGTRSGSYGISGVYPYYQHMRRIDVQEGTFFTELDENTHSRVAILGADVKKKLFSGQTALGEKVRVDGISYEVIGVMKHVIQNGDDNMNGKVYIPFSAMNDLTNTYYLNAVAMEYEGDHEKVAEAVRRSMAFHHEFDPKDKRAIFVFDVFADLLDLRVITTGIKILLGFIGLLTLGIGGVGLMNIMLVSVTQRTREIGVEKGSRRARLAHPRPVSLRSPGHHASRRPRRRAPRLPRLLVGRIAHSLERLRGKWHRRRHSSHHRFHHADRLHRDPGIRRHHQRHAPRDQSLAP